MAMLKMQPQPLAVLDQLVADTASTRLADRINDVLDVLDVLEADPADPRVRRRRFTDPPLWCITVWDDAEDWAILWELDSDDGNPVVVAISAVPF